MRDAISPLNDATLDGLVFEHASVPLVIFDHEGHPVRLNREARELAGLDLRDTLAPTSPHRSALGILREECRAAVRAHAELRVLDVAGALRHVALTAQTLGKHQLVAVRETTEAHAAEEELRHLRRMQSFGYMTASVVHDFNNLLTPMVCLTSLLDRELPEGSRQAALARDLRAITERAAVLARQMLTFARPGKGSAERIDLNDVASEMRVLVEHVVGEDVQVAVACDPSACDVIVDREQLEHVVLNLVANARDAMPRGGRLTIRAARIATDDPALDGLDATMREAAACDGLVALTVADTGIGMTPEIRERIFQRFYTTKAPGRGTGLGLATAHAFVTRSGGVIDVRSEPGKGTSVTILLPRATSTPSQRSGIASRVVPRGTETVLVVEDDVHVREVVRLVLEQSGYRVLATDCGEEALRVAAGHHGTIHLVIADVVMPRMSGRAVVDALRATRPEIRYLYVSGHTDDALERAGGGIKPLLRKAFSPSELEDEVRRVLDEEAAA